MITVSSEFHIPSILTQQIFDLEEAVCEYIKGAAHYIPMTNNSYGMETLDGKRMVVFEIYEDEPNQLDEPTFQIYKMGKKELYKLAGDVAINELKPEAIITVPMDRTLADTVREAIEILYNPALAKTTVLEKLNAGEFSLPGIMDHWQIARNIRDDGYFTPAFNTIKSLFGKPTVYNQINGPYTLWPFLRVNRTIRKLTDESPMTDLSPLHSFLNMVDKELL